LVGGHLKQSVPEGGFDRRDRLELGLGVGGDKAGHGTKHTVHVMIAREQRIAEVVRGHRRKGNDPLSIQQRHV
jgi:hypothetical protein